MNIEILWTMVLVTSAFGAVVARDIPPGPDLEVDDVMIAEEENVMDYGNHTVDQNTNRQGNPDLVNVRCDFNGQYKPHPMTCSKFVQCSWSTPKEQTCPLDTVWFQSELTCVHSPSKNCDQIAPVSPSAPTSCSCGIANPTNRIVGGVEVYPPRKYPWQVGLFGTGLNPTFNCGGSIINNRFVLTAAHCVYELNASQKPNVYIGVHDRNSVGVDNINTVKQILIHPCYNCKTKINDFALFELNDPIVFNDTIKPVCLPDNDRDTYANEDATVSGWGDTAYNGNPSPTLLELDVKILNNNLCEYFWSNTPEKITPNHLCAADPNTWDKNVCNRDSGGPLVMEEPKGSSRYIQVGVVSFGFAGTMNGQPVGCNVLNKPGVYGRVSKVLDWIKAKSADGQYCTK